jgi:hypothetical protein
MTEKTELLCKDCKHSFRTFSNWMAHGSASFAYSCRNSFHPERIELDPVVGPNKIPAKYDSCGIARMGRLSRDIKEDHCGPDAKFWQPKHKKDLFKLIKKEHNENQV